MNKGQKLHRTDPLNRIPVILIIVSLIVSGLFSSGYEMVTLDNGERMIRMTGRDGQTRLLKPEADADDDGIENQLELGGYVFNSQTVELEPWDGDSSKTFFFTDPLTWSTDQDPYSDYTEATGANMPPIIKYPERHPLVAARPNISIKMSSFEVVLLEEITTSNGGSVDSSFTNETSNSNTVGGSVTVEASLNPFKLVSAQVEANYSHTWSSTTSSTVSSEINWNKTRSTKPDEAARLILNLYMENSGSAAAANINPLFVLKLGDKVIKSISWPENRVPELLPPGGRFPEQNEVPITIEKDDDGSFITITLDDLRAIQSGAPLSLIVVQVSGDVMRWNSQIQGWETDKRWSDYEFNIDAVSTEVLADLGDNETYRFQVATGNPGWLPGFTLRDVVRVIFDMERKADGLYIEDRKYPDNWYFSSPSQELIDAWNDAGQPQNILKLDMMEETRVVLFSPGLKPSATVNLATYSPDFKSVYVSALPNNFPIQRMTAHIPINGGVSEFEMTRDAGPFWTTVQELPELPDEGGRVVVENVVGDISEKNIVLPAIYTSAKDVQEYSRFLPVPGGDFMIFPGGDEDRPIPMYCLLFDPVSEQPLAAPREYLPLTNGDGDKNFIDWIALNNYRRVYFEKVRMDPTTLTINTRDLTFTTIDTFETDEFDPDYDVPTLFYGRISTSYAGHDTGYANIDLSDLPLRIDTTRIYFENEESGSSLMDTARQVVNISHYSIKSFSGYSGYFGWRVSEGLEDTDVIYLEYRPFKKVTAIGEPVAGTGILPETHQLDQNYPNPFNPSTTIAFKLVQPAAVTLAIYDVLGREVIRLAEDRDMTAGSHQVTWDGRSSVGHRVASGVYIYRIRVQSRSGDEFTAARKMMLMR